MTRNTKEVAIISHRTGKLSEMPKALHQSEIGLAKDENRIFIGNPANALLNNREVFPYQNLELLTEFSELKDYFKYSYENNITKANGIEDRLYLKEFLPIVFTCNNDEISIRTAGKLIINGHEIQLNKNDDLYKVIDAINSYVPTDSNNGLKQFYATSFPGTGVLTLISLSNNLTVTDNLNGQILNDIGFSETPFDISMPIRKVTEKLDDQLNITDFAIKGDGENVSKKVFDALVEVYKNCTNNQFYRCVFFPAGSYSFQPTSETVGSEVVTTFSPLPLVSNLHIRGEGIDRTKIDNATTYTLLSCLDDSFNGEYGDATLYGKNFDFPRNIVIEDMTISGDGDLARLIACSNVTFNRVKFVGSGSNTLVTIAGKQYEDSGETDYCYASDIKFNDCIFESAGCAIDILEAVENVSISNCTFSRITVPSVKVGDNSVLVTDDKTVRGVIINDCTFEETITTATSLSNEELTESVILSVIALGTNSEYVTTTNCIFDKEIIEKTNTESVIPYYDNGVGALYTTNGYSTGDLCFYNHNYYRAKQNIPVGESFNKNKWDEYDRYNYTDILDIATDELKLLRFKFSQPQWEYINYLTNKNGKIVLTVDGSDSDITASNGLNIKENSSGVEIKSVKGGTVTLSMNKDKNMMLAKGTSTDEWAPYTPYTANTKKDHGGITYTCTEAHTSSDNFLDDLNAGKWTETSLSEIILYKVLQLNNCMISNRDGTDDIIVEPATDKVIQVKQTADSATNYETKIVNKPDAIPNVAFVRNYSTSSLIKHITYEDLENMTSEDGYITIGEFDKNTYGDNVHITGVTVNVRNPLYKVLEYFDSDTADYIENLNYYQGDVVKREEGADTVYAVVLKNHVGTNAFANNDNIRIIPENVYTNEVSMAEVIAFTSEEMGNTTVHLTNTYNYSFGGLAETASPYIDIRANNLFGYNNAEEFDTELVDFSTADKMVKFQSRNYVVNQTSEEISNAAVLHDPEMSSRLYDEGYIYKFDEDRNFNMGAPDDENPYSLNYSGGSVVVKLYDDEANPVTSLNKNTFLFNPAGDIVIKVDFVKEEF